MVRQMQAVRTFPRPKSSGICSIPAIRIVRARLVSSRRWDLERQSGEPDGIHSRRSPSLGGFGLVAATDHGVNWIIDGDVNIPWRGAAAIRAMAFRARHHHATDQGGVCRLQAWHLVLRSDHQGPSLDPSYASLVGGIINA